MDHRVDLLMDVLNRSGTFIETQSLSYDSAALGGFELFVSISFSFLYFLCFLRWTCWSHLWSPTEGSVSWCGSSPPHLWAN